MQQIITTGKTVDLAVQEACTALGKTRDEVTFEVLEYPHRRLFGSVPAKVLVTVREEEFSVRELLMGALEPEKPRNPEKPAKPEKEEKAEKPAEKPKESASKPERGPKPEKKKQDSVEQKPESVPVPQAKPEPAPAPEKEELEEEISLDALPVGANAAFEYLRAIAAHLGIKDLELRAVKLRNGVKFYIGGEDVSALIGRRGETMDALQYLCLLVSNRADSEYCRITLDVANYREKREETLKALARRVSAKVQRTHYSQTLEPMNPYERRIVHSEVQKIEGVRSESIGEESNRRVVIMLESGGKTSQRGGKGRSDGRRGRGGRRRGGRGHKQGEEGRFAAEKPEAAQKEAPTPAFKAAVPPVGPVGPIEGFGAPAPAPQSKPAAKPAPKQDAAAQPSVGPIEGFAAAAPAPKAAPQPKPEKKEPSAEESFLYKKIEL